MVHEPVVVSGTGISIAHYLRIALRRAPGDDTAVFCVVQCFWTSGYCRPKIVGAIDYIKNQSKIPAATVMIKHAAPPKKLDQRPFTKEPIIVGLLEICNTIAIKKGAVTPYKTAASNNASIGLILA